MSKSPAGIESPIAEAGCNSEIVRQRLGRISDSYAKLELLLTEYESIYDEESVARLIDAYRPNKPR